MLLSCNSTVVVKGVDSLPTKRIFPVSDDGLEVDVGEGVGFSVEVGTTVADGVAVTCAPQAVSNTTKNKIMDGKIDILLFMFFS